MSSVTDPPSLLASPTPKVPRQATLDELYAMTSVPEHREVIRGVNWAFYEQLVDSIPEGVDIHADYDGKDVEVMALSPFHDGIKKRMGAAWSWWPRNWRSLARAWGRRPGSDRGIRWPAWRPTTAISSHPRSWRW